MLGRDRNATFLILLVISLLIFTLSNLNLLQFPQSILSKATTTVSSPVFSLGSLFTQFFQNDNERKLKEDNLNLQKRLIDQQKLLAENKALHDQFQTAYPRSLDLLPADVVSAPRFVPGIFSPDNFVIDRGTSDNVKVGSAVVIKDNLAGKVTKVSAYISEVSLTTNPLLKFAAKTSTGVLGVVKGQGNGDLLFDNVLLSEHLEKGQLILTSGDLKIDQTGFPPDITVGQIISIDKNPTDLFQRAKLKTLIDFSKISEVFVVKGLR